MWNPCCATLVPINTIAETMPVMKAGVNPMNGKKNPVIVVAQADIKNSAIQFRDKARLNKDAMAGIPNANARKLKPV